MTPFNTGGSNGIWTFVLINALNPFGYGHLLPRGLLREPLSSLVRAESLH